MSTDAKGPGGVLPPRDPERRPRRTVRLALDGLVVAAGVGQASGTGALVVATARRTL
ncbi:MULTISPECIES: hypothetical protein [unclassified Streptomyces]|uniref:hypothetical protein n=1 Tax=unclassified Streptomyces TaxID=2593676 RepID=UPI0037F7867A